MISRVEDYRYITGDNIDAEHPHGDLDRIVINGEIMPLREGVTATGVDRKNILRGEDVAFLMEGCAERQYVYIDTVPITSDWKFRRKLFSRFTDSTYDACLVGIARYIYDMFDGWGARWVQFAGYDGPHYGPFPEVSSLLAVEYPNFFLKSSNNPAGSDSRYWWSDRDSQRHIFLQDRIGKLFAAMNMLRVFIESVDFTVDGNGGSLLFRRNADSALTQCDGITISNWRDFSGVATQHGCMVSIQVRNGSKSYLGHFYTTNQVILPTLPETTASNLIHEIQKYIPYEDSGGLFALDVLWMWRVMYLEPHTIW